MADVIYNCLFWCGVCLFCSLLLIKWLGCSKGRREGNIIPDLRLEGEMKNTAFFLGYYHRLGHFCVIEVIPLKF